MPPRLSGRSPSSQPQVETLEACAARWRDYLASEVDFEVDACDDMLVDTPDGRTHYRRVGLSAIELLTDAMVLTGRPQPRRILDIPCGGGRVTRHLVRFFPDADIVVADVEGRKVEAVTRQFGVRAMATSADFTAPFPETFDLIFVGSLLNHFGEPLYRRALQVLLDGLSPGGALVVSATARTWVAESIASEIAAGKRPRRWWSPIVRRLGRGEYRTSRNLAAIDGSYARTGFAYLENVEHSGRYGRSYGGNWASPSWLMRLVEPRTDVRILALKERGYDHYQDALMLQHL